MSYAVYRAAAILFGGVRVAATAAILLNVTLDGRGRHADRDAGCAVAGCRQLRAARARQGAGDRTRGVVAGGRRRGRCALLSKYSALFFGPAILIWLLVVPKQRHWLLTPWPYLGGLLALAIFSPVLIWNAEHHWVSFLKQISGRARIEDFRPSYLLELVPTQIAFATPLVFILGAMGLHALARRKTGALPARALINAIFWTITAYFVWHALHARVEANWFAPIYPAFMVAAAVAAHLVRWERTPAARRRFLPALGRADRHRDVRAPDRAGQHRLALRLPARCHRAQRRRRLARAGWRDRGGRASAPARPACSRRITAPRAGSRSICRPAPASRSRTSASAGSTCASPMRRSLPDRCFMSTRSSRALSCSSRTCSAPSSEVAELPRKRGPLTIETYTITLLSRPTGDVLDRSPPPELLR